MIHSDTNLLSDLEAEFKSTSSLLRCCDEKIIDKTRYLIHHNCIQTYFYRLSSINKIRFLKSFLQQVKNVGSLSLLLNTFHVLDDKMSSYCLTMVENHFNYDQYFNDHNRMLDDSLIETDTELAAKWFSTLEDADQVSVIISLLRISGGAIMHKIYKITQKYYFCRVRQLKPLDESTNKESTEVIAKQIDREFDFDIEYRKDDPSNVNCEKLRAEWKGIMGKYAKQIEKQEHKLYGMKAEKHKKKDKKSKKTKKKGKRNKSKGTRSTKSKKKGKKKKGKKRKKEKKTAKADSDFVQMFPITIVKKIFGYLDKKTLLKAKKVNEYWKWAVADYLKDLKAKASLAKIFANVEMPVTLNSETKIEVHKSPRDKRMAKLIKRGAILKKLRHSGLETEKHSILTETLMRKRSLMCYFGPYDKLDMHARLAKGNVPLYPNPEYICKDLNVVCKETRAEESGHTFVCKLSFSQLTLETTHLSDDSNSFY